MKNIAFLFLSIIFLNISSCILSDKAKVGDSFIDYKAISKFPKPNDYINDFEGVFTGMQEKVLDSIITNFESKTTNQITIVTVESFVPYKSLQDFTTDLGNYWRVGQSNKNNGLIITLSKKNRTVWIGTGYGTQEILTDELLQQIIDTQMIPYFKNDEYFEGIKSGLIACINAWE